MEEMVTLHLYGSPTLPKKYGKRIKAAHGNYSQCRGMWHMRYVTVPLDAHNLIDTLVREYPTHIKTTMVVSSHRLHMAPAWRVVYDYFRDNVQSPSSYLMTMYHQNVELWQRLQQEVR